jgi:hypothetical protein
VASLASVVASLTAKSTTTSRDIATQTGSSLLSALCFDTGLCIIQLPVCRLQSTTTSKDIATQTGSSTECYWVPCVVLTLVCALYSCQSVDYSQPPHFRDAATQTGSCTECYWVPCVVLTLVCAL